MPLTIEQAFAEVDKAAYGLQQGYTQGGYRGVLLLENAIHMLPSELTTDRYADANDYAAVERMRCAIMHLDPGHGGITSIAYSDQEKEVHWTAIMNPEGFGVITWEHFL